MYIVDQFYLTFRMKMSVAKYNELLSLSDLIFFGDMKNMIRSKLKSKCPFRLGFFEPDEAMTMMCEEIEMQSTVSPERLRVADVAEALQARHALVSGGKSRDGCPIITFPDNNHFHTLGDGDYQRLMLYLTSVPCLEEADLGFHLIIDRRKDRWNSVKTVLLKISVFFPGIIHVVYVIRPASFLQKALSEVSNKLFKDEFKFRIIEVSSIEELHEYIEVNQLTPDLGGHLYYSHEDWIKQRIELEKFSVMTRHVSEALDQFTKTINGTELPNDVLSTEELLSRQSITYSELKEEILTSARHGENLLCSIKNKQVNENGVYNTDPSGNVFAIERLLVQLEETERTFDEFWDIHSTKLRYCLKLRRFEQDFRELQANFDLHLAVITEMTDIGDTPSRVDSLLRDLNSFKNVCAPDMERAEEVIASGNHLTSVKNSCPLESVEPKCNELITMREILMEQLRNRIETLQKRKEFMDCLEKSKKWSTMGIELIASQKIENCSPEQAEKYIEDVQCFIKSQERFDASSSQFQDFFNDKNSSENETYVTQVLKKTDDVFHMCEKHIHQLKRIAKAPMKSIVNESFESKLPCGEPQPNKSVLRKANTLPKMESGFGNIVSTFGHPDLQVSPDTAENNKIKREHVLTELLQTERIYVSEILSILTGYKMEAHSEEMQHLLPNDLANKIDVVFGNLDEIYAFHQHVFLKDLEDCISSTDLVAMCFVQRKDTFGQLYSYYCQNVPKSEELRDTLVDANAFFQSCQKKLCHKLPLAAYLLKPVQRITKYQLLLKDLLKYSDESKCSRQLQSALDCMLVVLRCVNDSMHQISITGFPLELYNQGDLLLQGSFNVWSESKKDLRLRPKFMRRHIFLYQKAMLFCKIAEKTSHNKATYQFRHYLKMSQIGLTESVKGDSRKFEVWLQGRQEVHIIQAANIEQKNSWVNEIKRVLFNQLEELKEEKIKQYSALIYKPLRQTVSLDKTNVMPKTPLSCDLSCNLSLDSSSQGNLVEESLECVEGDNWSSECSNSDDEEHHPNHRAIPSGRYVALADYCAVGMAEEVGGGSGEVTLHEGDVVELIKVGCAGWWFVKVLGSSMEGWIPAVHLENWHRKSSRSSYRSQDRLDEQ